MNTRYKIEILHEDADRRSVLHEAGQTFFDQAIHFFILHLSVLFLLSHADFHVIWLNLGTLECDEKYWTVLSSNEKLDFTSVCDK